VCVCLFSDDYLTSRCKPDIEMFHDESWKPSYFGSKVTGQGHESQKHCRRGSLHSCECWRILVTCLVLCVSRAVSRTEHQCHESESSSYPVERALSCVDDDCRVTRVTSRCAVYESHFTVGRRWRRDACKQPLAPASVPPANYREVVTPPLPPRPTY